MCRRGKRSRRWNLLGLLVALVATTASLAVPAAADPRDRLDDIARKREQVQQGIDRAEAKADSLESRIRLLDSRAESIQDVVNGLDGEVAELDARISEVRADLVAAQQRFAALTEELLAIQQRLVARTDLFTDRAVDAYMAGPAAYLEGMLSSDSFSELTDRYAYYESTLDADAELIEEIEALRADVDARRADVEEEKQRIAEAKVALEEDREEVAAARAARQEALDQQRSLISSKESLLDSELDRKSRLEDLDQELIEDSERIRDLLAAQQAQSSSSGATTSAPPGGGQLAWPASGPITSGFGPRVHPIFGSTRMHTGLDIGAGYGSPVWAADHGVVVFAGVMSGYGNAIVVDHGGGLATTYNHLSAFSVSSGSSVARGQQIGNVGCTGYCTGPHLHFEVRVGGSPVDPMPYLQ